MKILVLASTLDLRYRLGCTPAWWQLLKAFHESGHEVIAVPYLGDPVETPWWRVEANPCSIESRLFFRASNTGIGALTGRRGASKTLAASLVKARIRPKWKRALQRILDREKDVGLVLMLNIPINQLSGIPGWIRQQYGIRVAYWDGDMPTILPETAMARGFRFSYYEGADLAEFDVFFSNSKGVLPRLREMGARDARTLYYAADPDLLQPVVDEPKCWDIGFYGHGSELREQWMTRMIAEPSESAGIRVVAAGGGFKVPLAQAQVLGPIPFGSMGRFVAKCRINLNITRTTHTTVEASATARPFELAALGACMVSQPYNGFSEWFQDGREVVMLREDSANISQVYQELLSDPERQASLGKAARKAIVDRHTWRHRVKEVLAGRAA